MTDKPDYSELIERALAQADHADQWQRYEMRGPIPEPLRFKDQRDMLRALATALTRQSAENARLRHEADTMIAASLGARINASMDNGWRDRADELAGLLKAALPWVAHEQPLCDRIVSMLTAPDPCGAVEMPEDAGGSLQKMQIAPAPFNQDAMNAKRPAPPK